MTKDRLLKACNAIANFHPQTKPRLEQAGRKALAYWVNASRGAADAACQVAIELQLLVEVHNIAARKMRAERKQING